MSVITEYDEERTMRMFREEWYAEGIAEGYAKGRAENIAESIAENKRDIAVNMLEEGISADVIERVTGISVDSLE